MTLPNTTPRRSLSKRQRAILFRDRGGICHLCGRRIETWQTWHDEHDKPRALGGSDDWHNRKLAHDDCHQIKTRKERKVIAKADRNLLANCGLDREGKRPWRSSWKPPKQLDEDWPSAETKDSPNA